MKRFQDLIKKTGFWTGIISLLLMGGYIFQRLYHHQPLVKKLVDEVGVFWETVVFAPANLTTGSIVSLLFLLTIGIKSSKYLAYQIGDRFLRNTKLNKGARAAVENLSYYILVVLFVLVALTIAKVPLTIFTFFGGALAIGLGFGSQNIVSNFISGIILQVEQPVKVGDIIEVEGVIGVVEHIGGRSTKILSGNNTHLILPNSSLLDKNLVNWTLQDNVIRSKIKVGIAYDSDLDLVHKVITETLDSFPDIMTNPAPRFLLESFGDSALEYGIYFWVPVQGGLERIMVESQFRMLLLKNFRTHNINIPFPMRTIIHKTEPPK